jgi:hypothetical protein
MTYMSNFTYFKPAPDEWWRAQIYYRDSVNRWALARLDDGIEIFIPHTCLYRIPDEMELAVRIRLSRKPEKRPKAIEAMPLSEYFKLNGPEPQEQKAPA